MSDTKHTPGPWRRGSDDLGSRELFTEIYAPNGFLVAVCQSGHERGKERRESLDYARGNANHIVRCVNTHDALLEALEIARNGLRWYQDMYPDEVSECDAEAMAQIDAAIAAATAPEKTK